MYEKKYNFYISLMYFLFSYVVEKKMGKEDRKL